MEMGAEKGKISSQERSLKDLSPNVEALLCYVAGWISGIVFLVLEQKNRLVRFHALQSIIVFGTLTLANIILGRIPAIGGGLTAIIMITGFVLWIILMVKAINGEIFKLPWAGNLAERLANDSIPPVSKSQGRNDSAGSMQGSKVEDTLPNPEIAAASSFGKDENTLNRNAGDRIQQAAQPIRRENNFYDKYYSASERSGRMIGSAFAIAWSVALLIFLNFYNQYIAWYEPVHSGGSTQWQMHTLVTTEFDTWLPIVTATLVLSIIGHAVATTFDKYSLRQTVRIVLDALSAVSVISLLAIFPFDFSVLPGTAAADGTTIGLTIGLIFVAVCCGISSLVNLIQLIVHSIKGEY